MPGYRIISSDNHISEPPDLWLSRMEPRFRDRAPRIVRDADGLDWWYCDGKKVPGTGFGFGGGQTGVRFEEGAGANLKIAGVFENVRPGAYIPEEQVKDMDIDGVDVSILYPTTGLQLFKQPDGEFLTDIFRAYNDWIAEFCQRASNRLKGIGIINPEDAPVAVKELERCKKMEIIGAMIPVYPSPGRTYDRPEYDPFWAAAQDMEMPVGLHLGTERVPWRLSGTDEAMRPSSVCNSDYSVRMSLADIIFAGVFERFPKLRVGSVEHEAAWVGHFLSRMNYDYVQRTRDQTPYRFKQDMVPSDFFHRNAFVSFLEDPLGIRLRDIVGVDNLMWGSDYPHHESTFPRSREIIAETLAGCTEEEKAKIAGGNAARVYHLN